MTLLTSSEAKLAALEGFGLTVTGRVALREENPVSG
jgi:3,4-dihydroxy 2-butanone 4-phosphate synthase/GTP cyclohydrolase II